MLLSMLDERDRLMVALREAREEVQLTRTRLAEVERERDALQAQIASTIPKDLAECIKELTKAKEELKQRMDEILELKAERNNTRVSKLFLFQMRFWFAFNNPSPPPLQKRL
ncbi:unnamed protein product [Dibothriocephalus latus]|uniref:Uncharacterized protein n=1 Tax=Dibothriocephalus latus TaxID=60516 RepID=A0A3P7LMA7_DIBLA|nr:unnamed protein product [Dibothriocephalus latus]